MIGVILVRCEVCHHLSFDPRNGQCDGPCNGNSCSLLATAPHCEES